ncbi:piwi-like protein 4 isoform X5 [Cavia porcellus]|uniref:piwi-like protein 4 isoform X5 n=1 Tax=Cavia porcellus TaxID=10141 RepID=UPI002FE194B8
MWQQEAPVVTAAAEPEAGRDGEQLRQPAGLGGRALGEPGSAPQEPRGQWKKFLYCEPHKRIKEVLEEELYIKRDECHIKNSPPVALERIWSIKKNLPVGGGKPGLLNRNSLLPQAKYYSRHGGLRSLPSVHFCPMRIRWGRCYLWLQRNI